MSENLHGSFDGPHGGHLIQLSQNSVTVIFDDVGYTWSKYGPTVDGARERAVIRALLTSALDALDAS